jgi:phosphoribosylaminoimidazole (AIR) synthetase
MPEPPLILSDAQKWSEEFPDLTLSDRQCYTTFHGGCGMVVVLANESEVIPFIDLAGKAGFDANCLGETTVSKDRAVHIKSRFKNEETVVLSDKDE